MRIIHVTQPTEAGVAVVIAALAQHQASQGHEVSIVCPPEGLKDGPLSDASRTSGVRLHAWPAKRSPGPSVLVEIRRLRGLLRALDGDVVVLHSAKAGLAGRLAVRNPARVVFVPHAWSFEAATGLMRRAVLQWERFAQRWTGVTVCVSAAEQERAATAGLRLSRMTVIGNGVDVERFSPGSQQRARQLLGLGTVPLAVCVGRLAAQKGQDRLVEAWPLVRQRVPDAELLLVGDGPARTELSKRSVPGVTLVGATRDPVDYYRAADVVAVSSRWEAGALVPLEAMATGRAVVSVDVTGVGEAVGDTGTVVPGGDDLRAIAGLANAIADRLLDPVGTRERGRQARTRAVERFSIERSLSIWETLLTSVSA